MGMGRSERSSTAQTSTVLLAHQMGAHPRPQNPTMVQTQHQRDMEDHIQPQAQCQGRTRPYTESQRLFQDESDIQPHTQHEKEHQTQSNSVAQSGRLVQAEPLSHTDPQIQPESPNLAQADNLDPIQPQTELQHQAQFQREPESPVQPKNEQRCPTQPQSEPQSRVKDHVKPDSQSPIQHQNDSQIQQNSHHDARPKEQPTTSQSHIRAPTEPRAQAENLMQPQNQPQPNPKPDVRPKEQHTMSQNHIQTHTEPQNQTKTPSQPRTQPQTNPKPDVRPKERPTRPPHRSEKRRTPARLHRSRSPSRPMSRQGVSSTMDNNSSRRPLETTSIEEIPSQGLQESLAVLASLQHPAQTSTGVGSAGMLQDDPPQSFHASPGRVSSLNSLSQEYVRPSSSLHDQFSPHFSAMSASPLPLPMSSKSNDTSVGMTSPANLSTSSSRMTSLENLSSTSLTAPTSRRQADTSSQTLPLADQNRFSHGLATNTSNLRTPLSESQNPPIPSISKNNTAREKFERRVHSHGRLLESINIDGTYLASSPSVRAVESDLKDQRLPHQSALILAAVRVCLVLKLRYPNASELLSCIFDADFKEINIIIAFTKVCGQYRGFQNLPFFKEPSLVQRHLPEGLSTFLRKNVPGTTQGQEATRSVVSLGGGQQQQRGDLSGSDRRSTVSNSNGRHNGSSQSQSQTAMVNTQSSNPRVESSRYASQSQLQTNGECECQKANGSNSSKTGSGESSSLASNENDDSSRIGDSNKENFNSSGISRSSARATTTTTVIAETTTAAAASTTTAKAPASPEATTAVTNQQDGVSSETSGSTKQSAGKQEVKRQGSLRSVVQRERRYLHERVTCVVCDDRSVEVTFLPCGHFIVCDPCSNDCKNCPKCDQKILAEVRTFLN